MTQARKQHKSSKSPQRLINNYINRRLLRGALQGFTAEARTEQQASSLARSGDSSLTPAFQVQQPAKRGRLQQIHCTRAGEGP